jgi:hypothetical protein
LNKRQKKRKEKQVEHTSSTNTVIEILPETNNNIISLKELLDFALDFYRLENSIIKIIEQLDENDRKRIVNAISRAKRILMSHEIDVTDELIGTPYNDGINVEVSSFEEDDCEIKMIKEVITPQISYKGRIERKAVVVIAKPQGGTE